MRVISILKSQYSYLFVLLSILLSAPISFAQERLNLEQAVQIALQNNYDIKLTANEVEIAKTDVSRGIAAMLPVVTGNFSTNNSIQNSKQIRNGQLNEFKGARSSNISYGPVLNWQIFDGFGMFAQYDQLKELQKLGESNLQLTLQTTIADVLTNYYDLVQQQQQIKALQTALEISRLRLRNSRSRYEIGKAAKLEVLAASVDLNTDTTNLLRQRDVYRSTKIRLNELLARDITTDFTVADTILIQNNLSLPELQQAASLRNPLLQSVIINQRIANLNLKKVRANRYPDISVSSGYNFNKSTSELNFASSSQGRGLNYGLSASINIFNGFLQKHNEKVAAIEINSSTIQYEKTKQNITSQLTSLYQTYITNLELVSLEEENLGVAKQNLDITLEKFRLGSITPVEFREAQRNYLEVSARNINAQFQAKLAEITLKQITGTLLLR